MITTCEQFLRDRISALVLSDGTRPYDAGNIFFKELPRDYLKDNDFAGQCLRLKDRRQTDGRIIARVRNQAATHYEFTRRRYRREALYRCLLYAARHEELWGEPGFSGLVDQFEQAAAQYRVLADADNRAVRIELNEAVRPWDSGVERDRRRNRPHLAIVRIEFCGGIHTTWSEPIIPSVEITPDIQ
jgi:hypothetical protein